MLRYRKAYKRPIIDLSCFCELVLCFFKELCVLEPDARHLKHILKSTLVQLIYDLVKILLADNRELFRKLSGLFQKVEPKFVASWEVSQGSDIKSRSLLEAIQGHCKDRVPPTAKVVNVGDTCKQTLAVELVWRNKKRIELYPRFGLRSLHYN